MYLWDVTCHLQVWSPNSQRQNNAMWSTCSWHLDCARRGLRTLSRSGSRLTHCNFSSTLWSIFFEIAMFSSCKGLACTQWNCLSNCANCSWTENKLFCLSLTFHSYFQVLTSQMTNCGRHHDKSNDDLTLSVWSSTVASLCSDPHKSR